jgi:hypothetical protein
MLHMLDTTQHSTTTSTHCGMLLLLLLLLACCLWLGVAGSGVLLSTSLSAAGTRLYVPSCMLTVTC